MHEIICPHCSKVFKIDETGYADIIKQVRDSDFEHQLHERLELAEKEKQSAVELAKTKLAGELQQAAAAKDAEIQALKTRLETEEVARQLAVTQALGQVEKERDALANRLAQANQEKTSIASLAKAELTNALQKLEADKAAELQNLKARLGAIETEKTLAITQAVSQVEKERDELKSNLVRAALEKELAEQLRKFPTPLRMMVSIEKFLRS